MPLSLQSRRVGRVTIVTCHGQIVIGEEAETLGAHLDALIVTDPLILLNLGGVDFVDSAGLGLLVRYLTCAQNASGSLRICEVSPSIDRVLSITRLKPVLQPHATEADAIVDAHRLRRDEAFAGPDILCVDESRDVLAYLRELLKGAGFHPVTAANLPDALILLTATQPRVIVIGATMRGMRTTRSAEEFHRLANAQPLVELPEGFARQDAGEAGARVLDAIRAYSA
jgi:anti-sigma B factor antagonist